MVERDSDLRKRLTDHIKKTGYPLEIQVSQALSKQRGWISWSNQMYIDPDDKKPREVDVGGVYFPALAMFDPYQATQLDSLDFGPIPFAPQILVECKKSSDNSLVLFPTRPFSFTMLEGQILELPFLLGKKQMSSSGQFGAGTMGFLGTRFHYNGKFVSSSYTLTKPGAGSKPDIYEAVMVLMKAQSQSKDGLFSTLKQTDAQEKAGLISKVSTIYPVNFTFLAIVFQGSMFEAEIVDGEPVLKDLNHGYVNSVYWSTQLERPVSYVIDVVSSTHFQDYLELLRKDVDTAQQTFKLYETEALAYLTK